MNIIFKTLLFLSLSGSFFILILFLCNFFLKDKISRQWQYYIWMIVILRLLIPFVPETSLMNHIFQTRNQMETQENLTGLPEQNEFSFQDKNNMTGVSENQGGNGKWNNWPLEDAVPLLSNIWFLIAVMILIRKITIYQSFVKYIKANQIPVCDVEFLDRVTIIGEQIGIKRAVELCINPILSSPLLCGFFRPCIVLPSIEISEKDFQYTILHELTHYQRKDMFYKWLVQITVCLHWFNPLVYFMEYEINKTCEFSCDEAIIRKLDFTDIQDYGKTLLNAMVSTGKYKEGVVSFLLKGNKKLLKERLDAIMKFKNPSKKAFRFTILLTVILSFGVFYTGAYGIDTKNRFSFDSIEKKPSLILDIKNAAITVEAATDNAISAEYNSEVYDVRIEDQNNEEEIVITCQSKIDNNQETIKLFLPDTEYQDIKMNFKNTYFTSSQIQKGNMVAAFDTSAVFLTLPENFTGSLEATVTGGNFELISQDDFHSANITITDDAGMGMIYVPKYFSQEGNVFHYANGEQKNKINIVKKGIGVISIYSSDRLKDRQFNFDKEDGEENWESKLKKEWEENWESKLKKEWGENWKKEWKENWKKEWPCDFLTEIPVEL